MKESQNMKLIVDINRYFELKGSVKICRTWSDRNVVLDFIKIENWKNEFTKAKPKI